MCLAEYKIHNKSIKPPQNDIRGGFILIKSNQLSFLLLASNNLDIIDIPSVIAIAPIHT